MNDEKSKNNESGQATKRSKNFYIRLAIIYAVAILLIILAINFDSFENTLKRIFSVITPIFYGAVIAYLCNPLYVFFQNRVLLKLKSIKWRKSLSILFTYIVVFLVIFALLFLVADQMISSVQSFVMNIDTYILNAENFIVKLIDSLDFIKSEAELEDSTTAPPSEAPLPSETTGEPNSTTAPENQTDETTVTPDETTSELEEEGVDTTLTADSTTVPESGSNEKDDILSDTQVNIFDFSFTKEGIMKAIHNFLSNSGEFLNQIGNTIVSSGTTAISLIFNLFLGFIFSVYMLVEKDLIIANTKKAVYSLFKKEKADAICDLGRYSDDKVGHFIKGKLIESLIVGVLAYILFLIFKIPSALMIAVIVAIMNIIPIFGPFLGAVPAALLVLIMEPSKAIPYIIIVVIIMQINGNYISPKIVGNRTGLSPLGAITALLLMSGYFGVIGMFLGIPICAIVVEMLWRQVNKRLGEKQLATDIHAYYPPDALVEENDPNKKPHNFTAIVVDSAISIFCKVFRVNKSKNKNNNDDGTSNE